MTAPRLTLLGSQHAMLTSFLESHPQGHERIAVVLFKRLRIQVPNLNDSDRYVAQEVLLLDEALVTGSSHVHVAFVLGPLREIFRRCEEDKLVFGFAHNHPVGPAMFSDADEENERTLLSAITNRNGRDITFVAMLWADGEWLARVRSGQSPSMTVVARHVAVLTDRITLFGSHESSTHQGEVQARQAAAFGEPFVDMMQSLRVGFVGNGGTGSPAATLAARSGVGEIVLIDKDFLETSNLNRVRGLTAQDVGKPKSSRLKLFIESIGLPVRVACYESLIDNSPDALDALASCDVVIGCTDDFVGREVLNTSVYAYSQILIDVGLGGRIGDAPDGTPILRHHFARISTIAPEAGQCLFCQGILRDIWIRTQYALRDNPNLSTGEMAERYLEYGDTDAPGVGPFTNAAADFAVASLFDLIKPFRQYPPEVRRDLFFVDFVKMAIWSPATARNLGCPYCEQREFLLLKESYRLQRPFLGTRSEFC